MTFHEALWIMPVLELAYEDLYVDYYYERAGYQKVLFREVTPPHMEIESDEKGNECEIYYLGGAHVGESWRPREKRSKGRRRPEKKA